MSLYVETLKEIGKVHVILREAFVSGWSGEKPRFKYTISRGGGKLKLTVRIFGSRKGRIKYMVIDQGAKRTLTAKKSYMVFPVGYRAHTLGGLRVGGPHKKFGAIRRARSVTQTIHARHVEDAIIERVDHGAYIRYAARESARKLSG